MICEHCGSAKVCPSVFTDAEGRRHVCSRCGSRCYGRGLARVTYFDDAGDFTLEHVERLRAITQAHADDERRRIARASTDGLMNCRGYGELANYNDLMQDDGLCVACREEEILTCEARVTLRLDLDFEGLGRDGLIVRVYPGQHPRGLESRRSRFWRFPCPPGDVRRWGGAGDE